MCHHGGSVKPIFTKLINLVPMEQFHHKPKGMYGGGLLELADHHYTFLYPYDDIALVEQYS